MTPELHQRVKELFGRLVDANATERASSLAEESPEVREAVASLLAEADRPHAFVAERLDGGGAAILARELGSERMPARIGEYETVRVLGEGGMGTVYEAMQERPRRRVALKVVRVDRATPELVRRFRREAEVLGQLQHPGIACVYEAGVSDIDGIERPFIAMEFIDGVALDAHVRACGLEPPAILELVARVADAMQHAHQKGVIHRDLKPANILVAVPTSSSGSSVVDVVGQPKVLDFGVSRIVGESPHVHTEATQAGQLVGTVAYMAPEQVTGDPTLADTRCDVHALGVLLFELLAGRSPWDLSGRSIPEAIRVIAEQDAPRLGSVVPALRGDVETIVAHALEKQPDRRYASAGALADDLRRHLRDEPILARPATAWYQMRKFARRNRGLVAGLGAAAFVLVASLVVVSVLLADVAAERDAAELARQREVEVARFQAQLLDLIDVESMGRSIVDRLHAELAGWAAASFEGTDPTVPVADVLGFVDGINGATAARATYEENLVARAVAVLDDGYTRDPLVEAMLREAVARMYQGLYRYEQQLVQDRRALELRREVLGASDELTLSSLERCAAAAEGAMQFDEARTLAEEAAAALELALGADHPRTARARARFAALLIAIDADEAASILKDVLATREGQGLRSPADVSHERSLLASALAAGGHLDEAIGLLESLLADPDVRGLDVLGTKRNLAGLYVQAGRLPEAIAITRSVVADWERKFGAEHEGAIVNRSMLASLLLQSGDASAAEIELARAWQDAVRGLEPNREHRTRITLDYSRMLLQRGAFAEAEVVAREGVETRRSAGGPFESDLANLEAIHQACLRELDAARSRSE